LSPSGEKLAALTTPPALYSAKTSFSVSFPSFFQPMISLHYAFLKIKIVFKKLFMYN